MRLIDLDKLSERKYKEVQFDKHGWANQASMYRDGWNDAIDEIIDNEEVIDAVPVRHGRWIERESGTEDKENGFETVIVCSRCDLPATTFYSEDCESRTQIRTAFCPNCGADMRKDGVDNGQIG